MNTFMKTFIAITIVFLLVWCSRVVVEHIVDHRPHYVITIYSADGTPIEQWSDIRWYNEDQTGVWFIVKGHKRVALHGTYTVVEE